MKKTAFLFALSLLVLPLSAQFKAKMVFNSMGKDHTFIIYSSDEGYRYEFNENGQEGIIIVKKDIPDVIILMPQQKMAMKGSADSPMSMVNDPVSVYEYYKKEGTVKELGSETINGIKCTKSELWNISGDEYGQVTQKMFTIWTSDKFNFPVKMINHIDGSNGSEMELQDIEPWTPNAQSFEIPAGYQVMDMPKMTP
jgi:hypothetical protein